MPSVDLENMAIKDILSIYPETIQIFKSFGFNDFQNQTTLDKLGPILKLGTLLRHRNIEANFFLKRCLEIIDECPLDGMRNKNSDLISFRPTLLALLPCGLKVALDKAIQRFSEQSVLSGKPFDYIAEGNVNHELSYYPYIDSVKSIDELPDIILSADLNSFFHHSFLSRFVSGGDFVSVNHQMNERFTALSYMDPQKHFTMLSANILVMVHVKDSHKQVPIPADWGDLIASEYHKSVVMRGQEDFFCSGVLVPFYRLYGIDKLIKLSSSVYKGMHPSQMVKEIDSASTDISSVYIMPWFFAKKIKRTERISIIFPESGAFISPVQILIKKSRLEALKHITDFLMSYDLHKLCVDNYFPSPQTFVADPIPTNKKLFWIGWDFIYKNDLEEIKNKIGKIFTDNFLKSNDSLCE